MLEYGMGWAVQKMAKSGVVQSGVTLAGTRDHDREAVSPVLCGSYKRKRPHCRREKCNLESAAVEPRPKSEGRMTRESRMTNVRGWGHMALLLHIIRGAARLAHFSRSAAQRKSRFHAMGM
jgi:hypothetical protein